MTFNIVCDICRTLEDIDSYDVSEKLMNRYRICPPGWLYSPNEGIDITSKHDERVGRSVEITHVCENCVVEAFLDLLVKRKKVEDSYEKEEDNYNKDEKEEL